MVKQRVTYKIGLNAKDATSKMDLLNQKALKVAGSFGAIAGGAAFVALGGAILKATNVAERHAEAQARLEAVIKSTGQAATFNIQKVNAMSLSLSELTETSEDQIITGTAMLTSFNLTGDSVAKLMPAMADMSVFLKQDMKASALLMGKAMTVGASALSRVGVTLSDVQKEAFNAAEGLDKAALLAEILGQNFGGAAAAVAAAGNGLGNFETAMDSALKVIGDLTKSPVADFWNTLAAATRGATGALKDYFKLEGSLSERENAVNKVADRAQNLAGRISSRKEEIEKLKRSKIEVANSRSSSDAVNRFNADLEKRLDARLASSLSKLSVLKKELRSLTGLSLKVAKEKKSDSPSISSSKKSISVTNKKRLDEFGFVMKSELDLELARHNLALQNEQQKQNAIAEIKANALEKQKFLDEQNNLIRIEQESFNLDIEKQASNKRIQIRKDEAERVISLEQQKQRLIMGQVQAGAGLTLSITQQLANDIATSQENSVERAVAAFLTGTGQHIVGIGTQAVFSGTAKLFNPATAPIGAAEIAFGSAAIATGIGMGAGGAAINASISGGSSGASRGSNTQLGGSSTQAQSSQNQSNNNAQIQQETTRVIIQGSVFGNPSEVVNSYSRAQRRVNKYSLREV